MDQDSKTFTIRHGVQLNALFKQHCIVFASLFAKLCKMVKLQVFEHRLWCQFVLSSYRFDYKFKINWFRIKTFFSHIKYYNTETEDCPFKC